MLTGLRDFLLSAVSKLATYSVGTGDPFAVEEEVGREADQFSPSSTEVKDPLICTSSLPYMFMAWCLTKPKDNFTFLFIKR